MPEPEIVAARRDEPMIVNALATPWGFLVALPLALALAFVGASQFDVVDAHHPLASLGSHSISLLGMLLIAFALYLFMVGVGELAAYLKPAVEVVLDREGVAVYGLVGQRSMPWRDIAYARLQGKELVLTGRAGGRPGRRSIRLHLGRLAIDPNALLRKLHEHRPDLLPILRSEHS